MASSNQRSEQPSRDRRITVPKFSGMKGSGRKISMLTAYDYAMARLVDEAGVEGILVGDSMSMVVQGHENTLPVTLDEMIYHAEMVGRAVNHALVVVDMPFPSYHLGPPRRSKTPGGFSKRRAARRSSSKAAPPGRHHRRDWSPPASRHGPRRLRPQSVHQLGGYRVQRDEAALLHDARAAAEAGAFRRRARMRPLVIAKSITEKIASPRSASAPAPTATGRCWCCTTYSALPATTCRVRQSLRRSETEITRAVTNFRNEVRDGQFPGPEHGYK